VTVYADKQNANSAEKKVGYGNIDAPYIPEVASRGGGAPRKKKKKSTEGFILASLMRRRRTTKV